MIPMTPMEISYLFCGFLWLSWVPIMLFVCLYWCFKSAIFSMSFSMCILSLCCFIMYVQCMFEYQINSIQSMLAFSFAQDHKACCIGHHHQHSGTYTDRYSDVIKLKRVWKVSLHYNNNTTQVPIMMMMTSRGGQYAISILSLTAPGGVGTLKTIW